MSHEEDPRWDEMWPEDIEYMRGPKNWPDPCVNCRGRTSHSKMCIMVSEATAPIMPMGKHKGKSVTAVPKDYLHWILQKEIGQADFRIQLEQWLLNNKEIINGKEGDSNETTTKKDNQPGKAHRQDRLFK